MSDSTSTRVLRGLMIALVVLVLMLFLLLRSLSPSSPGTKATFDQLTKITAQKQVKSATFLDHDSRVVVVTNEPAPRTLWTSYPSSGVELSELITAMVDGGATVDIDQQSG